MLLTAVCIGHFQHALSHMVERHLDDVHARPVRCRRVLLALAHFAWQIENSVTSSSEGPVGGASSSSAPVGLDDAATTAECTRCRVPVQATECWKLAKSRKWTGARVFFGSMRLAVNEPATSMQGVIAGGHGGLLYSLSFPERISLGLQRHSNPMLVASDGSRSPLVPQAVPTRSPSIGAVEGVVPCSVRALELHVGAHRTIAAHLSDLQDFIIGVEDIAAAALKQSSRVASRGGQEAVLGAAAAEASGCCSPRATVIRRRETLHSLAMRRCCWRSATACCCGGGVCCCGSQSSRLQRCVSSLCSGRPIEPSFEVSSILLCACACALYSVAKVDPVMGMPAGTSLGQVIALGFYKCSLTIALVFNGYNAIVGLARHWSEHRCMGVCATGAAKHAVTQLVLVVLASAACIYAFADHPDNPARVALASPLLLVFLASSHVNKMMRRTIDSVLQFTAMMCLIFTVCNTFAFAGFWSFGIYFRMNEKWAQDENAVAAQWFNTPYHAFLLFFGMLIGAPWGSIAEALQRQLNSVWPAFIFCFFIALGRVVLLNLLLGNLVDSYRGILDSADERHRQKSVKASTSKHAIVLFATNAAGDSDQCVFELLAPVTAPRAVLPRTRVPLPHLESVEMKQNPIHQDRGGGGGDGDGLHEPLLGADYSVHEDNSSREAVGV